MDKSLSDLEQLEAAINNLVRLIKRPIYWEKMQNEANIKIDRLSASILSVLYQKNCVFQTLVEKVGIEAPSVSRKVHELENHGLIIRKSNTDARVHDLYLSHEGQVTAQKIIKAKRTIMSRVLSSWSESEKKQLINVISKLSEDMSHQFEENNTNHIN